MRYIIPFLIFLTTQLTAAQDSEQMVVQLATEKKLMPLYFGRIPVINSGFDENYIQKLRALMIFDLSINGMSELVANTQELDQYLQKQNYDSFGDLNRWATKGIRFVVKAKVRDKEIDVRVVSIQSGAIKGSEKLPLTGDFNHDRRQIHRLADAVEHLLFGTEGIASTRILFALKSPSKENGKWESEIWEMDYDGGNAHQITHQSGYSVTPVYVTPKKGMRTNFFYYVSYKTGQPKIYFASTRDGIGKRFSMLKGNQLLPAISRQNDKVAFISDYNGNPDLFLQQLEGKTDEVGRPYQIYGYPRAAQGSPTFSPDGKKVAFVSNKDGVPKIYVMDLPKPGMKISQLKPQVLTKFQGTTTSPSWSPDGNKIAYSALTKGVRQIWMYDLKKNEEVQLTTGQENKDNPTWAPNSLHLAYNTLGTDDASIYILNVNQLKSVKVASGRGEYRFPNWEPKG